MRGLKSDKTGRTLRCDTIIILLYRYGNKDKDREASIYRSPHLHSTTQRHLKIHRLLTVYNPEVKKIIYIEKTIPIHTHTHTVEMSLVINSGCFLSR